MKNDIFLSANKIRLLAPPRGKIRCCRHRGPTQGCSPFPNHTPHPPATASVCGTKQRDEEVTALKMAYPPGKEEQTRKLRVVRIGGKSPKSGFWLCVTLDKLLLSGPQFSHL